MIPYGEKKNIYIVSTFNWNICAPNINFIASIITYNDKRHSDLKSFEQMFRTLNMFRGE